MMICRCTMNAMMTLIRRLAGSQDRCYTISCPSFAPPPTTLPSTEARKTPFTKYVSALISWTSAFVPKDYVTTCRFLPISTHLPPPNPSLPSHSSPKIPQAQNDFPHLTRCVNRPLTFSLSLLTRGRGARLCRCTETAWRGLNASNKAWYYYGDGGD